TRKLEGLIRSRRAPRALPSSCPAALRGVVAKALAPNPATRYASAREFQADLQAFLERKPTVAEMEQRPRWSPGSTIEAARDGLQHVTGTAQRVRERLGPGGALACFATGVALWIGGSLLWQVRGRGAVRAQATAPPNVEQEVGLLYAAAGERILEAYRNGSD